MYGNKIINLGIMAHVDAGKTTVTEGFLYQSGLIPSMGRVDKGTTVTDSMALEQKRGVTIKASTISFDAEGYKINLIDTPGHMDFIAEVERSLSVLDGVILVISAKEGVQPQTRVIFHQLCRMKMPTLIFINKIDRPGVKLDEVARQVERLSKDRSIVMQEVSPAALSVRNYRWSETAFAEQCLIKTSDALLETYLEGKTIPERAYIEALRACVQTAALYPVYFGAALKMVGIRELLHGVVQLFEKSPEPQGKELSAYAYKLERDENHRKKVYVRLFSGELRLRDRVTLPRTGEKLTVRNLLCLKNGRQLAADRIGHGDIGVLIDAGELKCGDFLGMPHRGIGFSPFAKPLLQASIRDSSGLRKNELSQALLELSEEDPLLSVSRKEETGETTVYLFGRFQQEILGAVLAERYGLDVCFDRLKTVRRETPVKAAYAAIRIREKGNHYAAGIELHLEPLPPGSGVVYETRVSFGFIQKPFQNAVQEGVMSGVRDGLTETLTDVRIQFTDADYDSVMSTPSDYRRLAPEVVRKALLRAGVKLVLPIMKYRLIFPVHFEKVILGALTAIEATMENVEYGAQDVSITGIVPYDAAKDFSAELQVMTEGRGTFEMELLNYQ